MQGISVCLIEVSQPQSSVERLQNYIRNIMETIIRPPKDVQTCLPQSMHKLVKRNIQINSLNTQQNQLISLRLQVSGLGVGWGWTVGGVQVKWYVGDWTVGEWTVGEQTVGDWTVGEWTVGEWTVGEQTVGEWTVGEWTVGEQTVGEWTVGEWTVGE